MASYKNYDRGDFSWIDDCPTYQGTGYGKKMDKWMLSEAFQAIERVNGGWVYLADPDPVGEGGFMFSRESSRPEIRSEIDNEIAKTESGQGHSGASYGITMRHMEYIAKNGWLAYIRREWKDYMPPGKDEYSRFVNNIQQNSLARQMIPDIDKQAEAMRKFGEGKLSYAEMRTLCG